jgi:putative transposase
LLYRQEAGHPNDIWQADHTLLDLWLLNEQGQPARPWLTVIMGLQALSPDNGTCCIIRR